MRAISFILVGLSFVLHASVAAQERLSPIAARMQKFVDDQTVSGVVGLVAQKGKILTLDTMGFADIATQRPMREDTIFWIASMTKPLTATAVIIAQDDGKLSIDDPVAKYLPEFGAITVVGGEKPKRPVTIRDLMTHTSGVANPAFDKLSAGSKLADVVMSIAQQPLQFEPGSQWKYGSGLTVAGRIVEVVNGKLFEQVLDERVCQPVGMRDTTFYPDPDQRKRLAKIYRFDREQKSLVAATMTQNSEPEAVRRAPGPSGGLCSTARDYYRFLQMVLDGGKCDGQQVVSAAGIQQMTSLATGDMPTGSWKGLGWTLGWGTVREPIGLTANLSRASFGHGGAFGTLGWIDPPRDAVIVLLIARTEMSSTQETAIRSEFVTAAMQQVGSLPAAR